MLDCYTHRIVLKQFKNCKQSFLKKPLVALSLVLIVAMCLNLSEAAPRPVGHKRRHQNQRRPSIITGTKDTFTKNNLIGLYKNATLKLSRRLKNTKSFFKIDLIKYNVSRKHGNGNPPWLPKANFVEIHERGSGSLQHRFAYLTPRLYKHLMEYKVIFEKLLNVSIDHKDEKYHDLRRRRQFLTSTRDRLGAFITEVTDALDSVRIRTPEFNVRHMNLNSFQPRVDATQSFIQDHIAYRGYENLLKNWTLELKCAKRRRLNRKIDEMCREYEAQLNIRKNERQYRLRKKI